MLYFYFWWHHMVAGSILWHVKMLFLSDSSRNAHTKHNKAMFITSNISPHSPGYSGYFK
jgi:hypothetical protein